MDAKKKTSTTGSKTGSAKPAVAKGVKKKKVKKANADGDAKAVKKTTTTKTKKEEFKVMTLDEIEELFEKKSQIFHNKLLEYQQEKLQPLTFKLIMKYATDHSAAIETKMKKLEGGEASESKEEQAQPK